MAPDVDHAVTAAASASHTSRERVNAGAASERAETAAGAHRGWRPPSWRYWMHSVAGALLLFAFLRGLVVQVYGIRSGSMQPTLLVGDYVVASNTLFGAAIPFTSRRLPALRSPRAGDVVVYRPAGYVPARDHIKRIVGAPGDTVQMVRGRIYRNGTPLREPYTQRTDADDVPLPAEGPYNFQWQRAVLSRAVDRAAYAPTRDSWGPLVVPAGRYLMLGDYRNGSVDSRHTGFVPRNEIRGKILAVHWSQSGSAVRWSRIGNRP